MLLFLYNTLLGFLIGQALDILTRDRDSDNTPKKIDVVFFLKDNWQKILVSLILSLGISTLIHLNGWSFDFIPEEYRLFPKMEYALIGFAPEVFLQFLKKKYGFLQPDREKFFNKDTGTKEQ